MSVSRSSYLKNTTGGSFVEQKQGGTILGQSSDTELTNSLTLKESSVGASESGQKEVGAVAKIVSGGEFGKMRRGRYIIKGATSQIAALESFILSFFGRFGSILKNMKSRDTIVIKTVVVPPPPPAPDPNAPPTWTSNYDTAVFTIQPSVKNSPDVSLALETWGDATMVGGAILDKTDATKHPFDIQIDWGDGTTSTASNSNMAGQNHTYSDTTDRTITVTSSGNSWPKLHRQDRGGTLQDGWGYFYLYLHFREPNNASDPIQGVWVGDITSWGGLFKGYSQLEANDFIAGNYYANLTGINFLNKKKQILDSENYNNVGRYQWASQNANSSNVLVIPDHVPDTTSLFSFFDQYSRTQGYPLIPSVETQNFGNSVYQITDLSYTFRYCKYFVPDISKWRTDNVTTMAHTFTDCTDAPSVDLSSWRTGNVTDFKRTFYNYRNFNGDISSWDTSSATDMYQMFSNANRFNQDVGSWDVSNVTDMRGLFQNATDFDQDISSWDFSSVQVYGGMLLGTSFSQANYDALLISWAEQAASGWQPPYGGSNVSTNYTLGGAAEAARTSLIVDHGWTISDNGGV